MPEVTEKPVVRIASLSAFAPVEVEVRLEFEDRVELVPMRTLSYAEFQRLGWEVPNPVPPVTGAGRNGPITDPNDAGYRRALLEAEMKRAHKRLLASLLLEVPGATEDEKIAYLQTLDANRLRLLVSIVGQLVTEGTAHIEAKAAAFQP